MLGSLNFTRNIEGAQCNAHTRCSQLNQRRINLYWDKIGRTCTNDTILYTKCVLAQCACTVNAMSDIFFRREKRRRRKYQWHRPVFFCYFSLTFILVFPLSIRSFIVYIFIMTHSRFNAYEARRVLRTFLPCA